MIGKSTILDKQRIGTSISKKTRSDKFQTKLDP